MSKSHEYPCTDSTTCQPIQVDLFRGRYLIECYGAQGGTGIIQAQPSPEGGKGAYASGVLNLKKTTTFYLYIGGQGQNGIVNGYATGGWNGGGNSGKDTDDDTPGAGGGCTDIRLIKAEENDETQIEASLNSRIIVAAGGSGSVYNAYGAPGGDLSGYKVTTNNQQSYTKGELSSQKGRGENGQDSVYIPSSGAGAGYLGGKASSTSSQDYRLVSSSGSSYVAGYPGCDSLPEDARYRVFGSQLISPRMFNGFSEFPSFDSEGTETGHSGNGAVKITRLDLCSVCTEKRSNIILFCVVLVLTNNQNRKIKS